MGIHFDWELEKRVGAIPSTPKCVRHRRLPACRARRWIEREHVLETEEAILDSTDLDLDMAEHVMCAKEAGRAPQRFAQGPNGDGPIARDVGERGERKPWLAKMWRKNDGTLRMSADLTELAGRPGTFAIVETPRQGHRIARDHRRIVRRARDALPEKLHRELEIAHSRPRTTKDVTRTNVELGGHRVGRAAR